MSGDYLLDTNIVIAALSANADVVNNIDSADRYFISNVVLGEMLYGAINSASSSVNLSRLELFVSGTEFLVCDDRTARWYGEIKTSLRQKGRPIPDNDSWIAASAQQHSLILVTRDQHFDHVDDLLRIQW